MDIQAPVFMRTRASVTTSIIGVVGTCTVPYRPQKQYCAPVEDTQDLNAGRDCARAVLSPCLHAVSGIAADYGPIASSAWSLVGVQA